ncbi:UDP-N-acetylmuramoyl-tripeptide--D-alanyl-D-alanine ligase [Altericroceibacterium endophyticum]|uniref:UDP-N-acetylmuramoyl-tripeptide--D-alanyl-D-alanine ligase n=1 Tax=Altericroceibacterium endophyticum TaxID=1808508 RepID=A0A6I4T9A9_9SPHN|nr:UDP-N-acetylmuramoyl-tripeptide--D-alanyl-D-alanine ligase [Altericroceibacterium endophyticum]MXO66460.1 UDP-N-acetylmuramoyl-tripeptide--D-alanyl-D-alanine ligase [Altericroceibacterium endophyticum]
MSAVRKILSWPGRAGDTRPTALWTAQEIADTTGGTASGSFQVSGVEIDSRDVLAGDLFVALIGESMDGHRFIDKAFANGAAAAIVDRPIAWPHVLVKDTGAALEDLARAARARVDARIIGVTGSVGKTGVKEAIFAALQRSSRGKAHRSIRSYNNHVGVPLSISRMPPRSAYGIFEMGMNHAGEIRNLTAQVKPDIAVITTIAPAHIENLGSEAAIADAKTEIFEGLNPGGVAIIPADNPHYERLCAAAEKHGARIVSFGADPSADMRLLDAIPAATGGSLVTAQLHDQRLCYTVAEPGDHWVMNSLAVMATVHEAGGDLGAAGLALGEMGGLKGRGARHRVVAPGGHVLFIDESYNANPASMRATLAQLGQTPATRRVAVLGSMKELGDFAAAFHSQIAEPLAQANIDFAVLVGEEMAVLAQELGKGPSATLGKTIGFAHCDGPGDAIAALEAYGLVGGDAVLVKGSNSVGLGQVVARFTDRER